MKIGERKRERERERERKREREREDGNDIGMSRWSVGVRVKFGLCV